MLYNCFHLQVNQWAKIYHSWLQILQVMDMTDGKLAVGILADDVTFLTLLPGTVGWIDWPPEFHTL